MDDMQVHISQRGVSVVSRAQRGLPPFLPYFVIPERVCDLQSLSVQESAALAHEVAGLLYPSYFDLNIP